jgi:hypothetical protein
MSPTPNTSLGGAFGAGTPPTAQQLANVAMLKRARDKMAEVQTELDQSLARLNVYNIINIDLTIAAAAGNQKNALQLKYGAAELAEQAYGTALDDQFNQCRNIVYRLTHVGSCDLPFPADPAPPIL